MFENNYELMTMKVRPDTDAGGKAIREDWEVWRALDLPGVNRSILLVFYTFFLTRIPHMYVFVPFGRWGPWGLAASY